MKYPKKSEALRNSSRFKAYNERRKGVPRPEVGPKISEALKKSEKRGVWLQNQRGKPHKMSNEWREKQKKIPRKE